MMAWRARRIMRRWNNRDHLSIFGGTYHEDDANEVTSVQAIGSYGLGSRLLFVK